MRVPVLLPTYNEAANLEAIVEAILRESADTSATDVLIIDDNSPDGTGQLVDMLHRPQGRGLSCKSYILRVGSADCGM